MPAWQLNALSLALFGAAAVAFSRQYRPVTVACGALFMPAAAAATVAVWWPFSPGFGVFLLVVGLGVPALCLLLYGVDLVFAVFALEMTYPAMVCWVLWPALVLANSAGIGLTLWLESAPGI